MRLLLIKLLFLSFLSTPTLAQDSSQCGFIQDSNYRSLCRALAEKNASQCGFIQENDLRSMCRAITNKDASQCGFINNSDQRSMCRALTVSR
jgi:aerobic-type carbon monoxide dehydrogenase small subunit (CoxS/CutS family)